MNLASFFENADYLTSLVTFLVGFVAFVVYKAQKRDEKQSAATIIVMDIRQAEATVHSILERGHVDLWMKSVFSENNWAKYKHLFASSFSADDFASFNRFFDSWNELIAARKRMADIFHASLCEKAALLQQKLAEIDNPHTPEGAEERQKIIDRINREEYLFDPHEPKNRILHSLSLMGRLSNTVAFEKLRKQANLKS